MILLFQNKRKIFIIVPAIVFLILASVGIYFYLFKKQKPVQQNPPENQITHSPCLRDDEIATYELKGNRTSATSADIIISDKNTNEEYFRFQIDSLFSNHYHPYEFRKCGIYVIKEFNFSSKQPQFLPGFRVELWQYKYNGEGMPILKFAGENEKGEPMVYYSYDFRTDFMEAFLALIEGYSGDDIDNFVNIIKLKTKEDVFSLRYKDVINKNSDFTEGYFELDSWTKDSRYFWGRISFTSAVLGFYRIERDTWKVDIFSAPPGTQGGDALNPEFGYITYDDGAPWSGDAETDETYRQQWKKEGQKVHFYLYSFLTKEQILLATIDDPIYYFKPRWISDTELEYELPNGEKRIYKIQ